MDNVFGKARRLVLQLEEELARLERNATTSSDGAAAAMSALATPELGPSPEGGQPLSLQAQITSDLTILQRHIRTAESVALREVSSERRNEAKEYGPKRLAQLNVDYTNLSTKFSKLKKAQQDSQVRLQQAKEREDLLQLRSRTGHAAAAAAPQATVIQMDRAGVAESLVESNRRLDDYLAVGANVLTSLREQGSTLKSTQRRLLDIASTLGISTSVLRLIERRNAQDWIILFAGMTVTVIIMWLVVAYLR